MRLIDADELKRSISQNNKIPRIFQQVINAQPTVYDVDKVVEQLEEKVKLAYRRYMDCPPNSPCFARYRTQYEERKMCLEIVKGGGVDERI